MNACAAGLSVWVARAALSCAIGTARDDASRRLVENPKTFAVLCLSEPIL